jgi:hypothetical protein
VSAAERSAKASRYTEHENGLAERSVRGVTGSLG